MSDLSSLLNPSDTFAHRHLGPAAADLAAMLHLLDYPTLDALTDAAVPPAIRLKEPLNLAGADSADGEFKTLARLGEIADKNKIFRSCIGMGYYDCITPPVIQRNILENPAWYTAYTPYQAEIAQGRLEALLNFQTMVSDLTGLPAANASLLDEATAAAEAMGMAHAICHDPKRTDYFIADDCHPQTISVVRTRADAIGFRCVVGKVADIQLDAGKIFGLLVQYPATDGKIVDFAPLCAAAKSAGVVTIVAADLLCADSPQTPRRIRADIAIGSTQRFGVPMGFGGPHAAYISTSLEHIRRLPGRIVGVSKDVHGDPALRLALQTREQHIRREKATSNICTAQVLLAVIAGMFAVWHGPAGLKRIARRISAFAAALAAGIRRIGHDVSAEPLFDTIRVTLNGLPASSVIHAARSRGYNLRDFGDQTVGISLDETTTRADVETLLESFAGGAAYRLPIDQLATQTNGIPKNLPRTSTFLTHPVFNSYHSETEMLRYLHRLVARIRFARELPGGSSGRAANRRPRSWPMAG